MLLIGLIIACVLTSGVDGKTCAECKTDYGTTKTCGKIKVYLTCLETAEDAGNALCVLAKADAEAIAADWEATTGCALTGGCKCQYDFFSTDLSAGDPAHCNAIKKRVSCLKTQTDKGCDTTTTVVTLAGNSETRAGKTTATCTIDKSCGCELAYAKADIGDKPKKCTAAKAFVSCLRGTTAVGCVAANTVIALATAAEKTMTDLGNDCDISKTVCQCDLEYTKSDISADDKKCMASKKEISCLNEKTGKGCDGTRTVITAATSAETAINAITTCTKTSTCDCEIAYAKADIADSTKKCTEAKTFSSCITKSVKDGCSRKKMAVGTVVSTTITGLNTDCILTSVCTCQINFNKMDVSDDKKCDSSKAYTKCLDDITDTTQKGCNGASNTTVLKTDHEQLKLCTDSSMKPLMASLAVIFISAFVTLI